VAALSLEIGVLAIERRGAPDDLDDHGAGLPGQSLRDLARLLVDGTTELDLHELAGAQHVVEGGEERRRDALSSKVHERVQMVGLGPEFGTLLSSNRHVMSSRSLLGYLPIMPTLRVIAQAAVCCLPFVDQALAIAQNAATGCVPNEGSRSSSTHATVELFATLTPARDSTDVPAIYLGTLVQEVQLAFSSPDTIRELGDGIVRVWLHPDGRLTSALPIRGGEARQETSGDSGAEVSLTSPQDNVQGDVLTQFVVDQTGHVEMETLKILRTTHHDFSRAVRDVVREMRFFPAELAGCTVRQLVEFPFAFRLRR
jgi:TonB family protein